MPSTLFCTPHLVYKEHRQRHIIKAHHTGTHKGNHTHHHYAGMRNNVNMEFSDETDTPGEHKKNIQQHKKHSRSEQ